jgi:hypothetical protein
VSCVRSLPDDGKLPPTQTVRLGQGRDLYHEEGMIPRRRQVFQLLGETEDAWLYSSSNPEDPVQHLALNKTQYPQRPEVVALEVVLVQGDTGG